MTMKFTAQTARLAKGRQYVAGSSGSMFTPGECAERVLPHLRGGQLFAYLFRRFGYPNIGWDEHKNLVSYRITTPMRHVFLEITPYMGSDDPDSVENPFNGSVLMFGYCVEKSIEDEFYTCLKSGNYNIWFDHSCYREVTNAFEETMRNLLRPVHVRDVPINCYGKVDESKKMLSHVDAYHAAGYPIPRPFFKSADRWEQFTDALIILGNSNMEKGIEAVIEMAATQKETQ
jgi:hypothetical protein